MADEDLWMSLPDRLITEDWSVYTVTEIAAKTGYTRQYVLQTICRLRKLGIDIPYIRCKPGRKRRPAKIQITKQLERKMNNDPA